MSEIVGLVGMSHSPFATMLPPPGPAAPGGRFLADTARVAAAVRALSPDAVVVIGPDHFHANFYDAMPPFTLGVAEAEGFGDFGSRSGPLPVAADLAWAVRDGLAADGFDIALSYALTVDHGIVQSYDMVRGGADLPLVPLVVNTAAPPLPSMRRCLSLGRSLGAAVRVADAGRVLVVASGGLSHWLPSNDPRDAAVPADRRASMIHGRRDVRTASAARESRVRDLGGNPDAPVNPSWDAWFLKQLVAADPDPVTELGDALLEERAGSGGHEIRTWLIGFGAAARLPESALAGRQPQRPDLRHRQVRQRTVPGRVEAGEARLQDLQRVPVRHQQDVAVAVAPLQAGHQRGRPGEDGGRRLDPRAAGRAVAVGRPDLGVTGSRAAVEVAEEPLPQRGLELHRDRPQAVADDLRRLPRAGEVG